MFLVQTDQSVVNAINFLNAGIIPKKPEIYKKKFHTLPNTFMLPVRMGEFTIFPDIFTVPYPMVSEMVMEVMRLYRVEPFFRKVTLSDENSEQYKTYFLLYIDEESKTLFQDFVLRRTPEGAVNCIVSLDFAESILRRGAHGIAMKVLTEQEGHVI